REDSKQRDVQVICEHYHADGTMMRCDMGGKTRHEKKSDDRELKNPTGG
ncbi:unnamed protein product, partial [marine sediment metagenome]